MHRSTEQAAGQQTIRSTEGSDKTIVDSDRNDVGDEAVWVKTRAALEETAATVAQAEAAAAATELEQAELAVAAAAQPGGKLDRRAGRREPESGELGSASEDKVLEEEQEREEDVHEDQELAQGRHRRGGGRAAEGGREEPPP